MSDYVTNRFPITQEGFRKLEVELNLLREERPKIIAAISEARSFGDLSENAEYHAACERQSFIEGKIADLEDKKSRAELIDVSQLSGNTIMFGATVTLSIYNEFNDLDEEVVYQFVGEYEADPSKHMLSIKSPLAISLMGKEEGQYVEIETPGGEYKLYRVVKVEFK